MMTGFNGVSSFSGAMRTGGDIADLVHDFHALRSRLTEHRIAPARLVGVERLRCRRD